LEKDGFSDETVVGRVGCVRPIFDEFAPESAGLPPVYWFWEDARSSAWFVTGVEGKSIVCYRGAGAFYGVCFKLLVSRYKTWVGNGLPRSLRSRSIHIDGWNWAKSIIIDTRMYVNENAIVPTSTLETGVWNSQLCDATAVDRVY